MDKRIKLMRQLIIDSVEDARLHKETSMASIIGNGNFIAEQIINSVYNQALEDLLKEICIGCAYLNGLECTNPYGCPCLISQEEVVRKVVKLKK